jgi:O-methyltransferase
MRPMGRQENGERLGLDQRLMRSIREMVHVLSLPITVLSLFYHRRQHPDYDVTMRDKFVLACRMYRNTKNIQTGTSYKAHLAMTAKLLETPPTTKGVVVECGSWLGGSAANLSLACDLVGRDLIVYDSFEGLPAVEENDRHAKLGAEGMYAGDLETVRENVRKYGKIERCTFRKGWFKDTLPHHQEPVVLCLLDVDFQASLHDCVVNLWPKLTPKGYVFIDEYVFIDYCSLFFSESFWDKYFNSPPPGLFGAGTGVPLGQYYLGPFGEKTYVSDPRSIAYTRRDFKALWDYEPSDRPQMSSPE